MGAFVTEQPCTKRSNVNYFAQGMMAAKNGWTLGDAYEDARKWKERNNAPQDFTNDTKFWIKYGYDKYFEWSETTPPTPQP